MAEGEIDWQQIRREDEFRQASAYLSRDIADLVRDHPHLLRQDWALMLANESLRFVESMVHEPAEKGS